MTVCMYVLARQKCQASLFLHCAGTMYVCPVLIFLTNCLLWLLYTRYGARLIFVLLQCDHLFS